MKRKLLTLVIIGGVLLLGHSTAHAIPILQLYIEGAEYDEASQSWVWVGHKDGAPPQDGFTLWAIGNVAGPGGKGDILDVRLSVAYGDDSEGLTVDFVPTIIGSGSATPGEYQGFTDTSVPVGPVNSRDLGDIRTSTGWWGDDPGEDGAEVQDGSCPVLFNGTKLLPWHGTFGEVIYWQEFFLDDFTLTDSPIGDFIGAFPTDLTANAGQINAYKVTINGAAEDGVVHFDLYNHVQGETRGTFCPFSHDAMIAPEPFSGIVWLLIGLTWAGSAWMYRYYSQWRDLEQEPVLATATCEGTLALRDEQARRAASDVGQETVSEQQH
jgi:hypothetical protein